MRFNLIRSSISHFAIIVILFGPASDRLKTYFSSDSNDDIIKEANVIPPVNPMFMDFDQDGVPDDEDDDDDNDGISDYEEIGGVKIDPLGCNGSRLNYIEFAEETGNGDKR
jgi:hypothetical protein